MSRSITFTVPTEPRTKLRPRFGRGRAYSPQANIDAAKVIEYYLREQMHIDKTGAIYKPFCGPLYSVITFYMTKAKSQRERLPIKKPDLDNIVKMDWDSCEGAIFKNDSQIVLSVECKQWAAKDEQRTEIEIGEVVGLDMDDFLNKVENSITGIFGAVS